MKRTIYVCPGEGCAFLSMTPGKCRSHPYPCRAMGPKLVPLEVVPASALEASDDPRRAGGQMIDAGAPHTRGQVMFDSRNAVLVEGIETAVAHTTQKGQPGPDVVALTIHGRINRPPDDAIAAQRPAERVSHLHMMGWDAAADLVVDLQSLAARDGFELTPLLEEKWAEAESKGLTRRAPR